MKGRKSIKFTDEQVEQIAGFLDVLKRIHIRLMAEGYTLKDGKFVKPTDERAESGTPSA